MTKRDHPGVTYPEMINRIHELEDENRKLKNCVYDLEDKLRRALGYGKRRMRSCDRLWLGLRLAAPEGLPRTLWDFIRLRS